METGPAPFQPLQGPRGANLMRHWEEIFVSTDGLWKAEFRLVDLASLNTIAGAQGGQHTVTERQQQLLASLTRTPRMANGS
jgi:hypothetical protein